MDQRPLKSGDGVVVAELVRDSLVESIHLGVFAVVDHAGKLLLEGGNSDAVVFPRSTVKPLQALAMLSTGVDLSPLELALSTASHCGSLEHRSAIDSLLTRHGNSPEQLRCPEDWPLGAKERALMEKEVGSPSRLAMNCSGKHAGFLATCAHKDWDRETYLHPDHPLQRLIVDTMAHYTKETPSHSSTDGCGAPLHALSVKGLARAMAKVGKADAEPEQQLLAAVTAHSWALDGHGRDNTITIDAIGGIAKIGAEGLVVIATPEGVAVAVKILDGSMRATTPVALAALAAVGAITSAVAEGLTARVSAAVLGGNKVIGGLRTTL